MADLTIQERLRLAQLRVKALNSSREKIIGDARVEQNKLNTAYANLKELGIENPEDMTGKELKALEARYQGELEDKLHAIEAQLVTGEDLMKKYNALQESTS